MVAFADKQLLDRLFQSFTTDGSGNVCLRVVLASIPDGSNLALGTVTGSQIGTADTQKLGFYGATPIVRPGTYTPTNVTTDRAYDADATTTAELADVLGTLIADLKALGLIG